MCISYLAIKYYCPFSRDFELFTIDLKKKEFSIRLCVSYVTSCDAVARVSVYSPL